MLANGTPMKNIQEWLGHSNFNTTADVYSHVDFSAKIESAKIIDKTITRNNDAEKTKIITIDWVWPYETGTTAEQILANDKIDTQNAKSIRNYTFNIVVTGTQVNPNQN